MKLNFYLVWGGLFFLFSVFFFYLGLLSLYFKMSLFLEWYIFSLNSLCIYYVILIDWISLFFLSVVLLISSMIIIYSMQYMDWQLSSSVRFLFLILLFVLSMIMMISSPNLISILVGWDGLGLVSYCLVVFYTSNKSYLAGLITFLTNRLGDFGMLITVCWVSCYGSWHFIFYNDLIYDFIFYLLIISCFTSSAQIPFSCWLPAAMAAPTPVSALVHSSTLVTAGVYLLIRFYNQFHFGYFFLFLSLLTMMFSSVCAIYEYDLKKIIALSTLSQLGLMMTSLFLGMVDLSFFHLLSHAMFKSLLFLCSGILIYYMGDNQDIRFMGSVCKMMPLTSACFNISNLSLCGMPFLSGFYSKDIIIESSIFWGVDLVVFLFLYTSLGLTAGYSLRLFYYSMVNLNMLNSYFLMNDEFDYMKFSIFVLTLFSVTTGSFLLWLFNFDLVFILLPMHFKLMSFALVLMGLWISFESVFVYHFFSLSFYYFNSMMWYMMSYKFFSFNLLYNLSLSYGVPLMGWGEYYGASGLSFFLIKFSNFLQFYFFSSLKVFMLTFIFWLLILLCLL